jgi:hypothetical protein
MNNIINLKSMALLPQNNQPCYRYSNGELKRPYGSDHYGLKRVQGQLFYERNVLRNPLHNMVCGSDGSFRRVYNKDVRQNIREYAVPDTRPIVQGDRVSWDVYNEIAHGGEISPVCVPPLVTIPFKSVSSKILELEALYSAWILNQTKLDEMDTKILCLNNLKKQLTKIPQIKKRYRKRGNSKMNAIKRHTKQIWGTWDGDMSLIDSIIQPVVTDEEMCEMLDCCSEDFNVEVEVVMENVCKIEVVRLDEITVPAFPICVKSEKELLAIKAKKERNRDRKYHRKHPKIVNIPLITEKSPTVEELIVHFETIKLEEVKIERPIPVNECCVVTIASDEYIRPNKRDIMKHVSNKDMVEEYEHSDQYKLKRAVAEIAAKKSLKLIEFLPPVIVPYEDTEDLYTVPAVVVPLGLNQDVDELADAIESLSMVESDNDDVLSDNEDEHRTTGPIGPPLSYMEDITSVYADVVPVIESISSNVDGDFSLDNVVLAARKWFSLNITNELILPNFIMKTSADIDLQVSTEKNDIVDFQKEENEKYQLKIQQKQEMRDKYLADPALGLTSTAAKNPALSQPVTWYVKDFGKTSFAGFGYSKSVVMALEAIAPLQLEGTTLTDRRVDEHATSKMKHDDPLLMSYGLRRRRELNLHVPFVGAIRMPTFFGYGTERYPTDTSLLVSNELLTQALSSSTVGLTTSENLVMERIQRVVNNTSGVNVPRDAVLQNVNIPMETALAATIMVCAQKQKLAQSVSDFQLTQGPGSSVLDTESARLRLQIINNSNDRSKSEYTQNVGITVDRSSLSLWAALIKMPACHTLVPSIPTHGVRGSSVELAIIPPSVTNNYVVSLGNLSSSSSANI